MLLCDLSTPNPNIFTEFYGTGILINNKSLLVSVNLYSKRLVEADTKFLGTEKVQLSHNTYFNVD